MGRFGDADSATRFRRRGFGDGRFGDKIFRRCCFGDAVSAIDVSATGYIAGGRFGDGPFWRQDRNLPGWTFRRCQFGDGRFGDVNSVMDSSAMDISATYIPSWTVRRWTFRRRVFGDGHFGKNFEEK